MSNPAQRKTLTVLLAAGILSIAIIAGIALAAGGSDEGSEAAQGSGGLHGSKLPDALVKSRAPSFRLPAARGGVIDTRALRGRPYVVTFLYTRCPDVCPIIGQQLKAALRELGPDAGKVSVIAVSVDPRGDTKQAVQRWLQRQRQPANFRYAIGSKRQLEPVWKAYYAAPQNPNRPETSLHTASVWLIDAKGRIRTKFSGGAPIDPKEVASDLRTLLDETSS